MLEIISTDTKILSVSSSVKILKKHSSIMLSSYVVFLIVEHIALCTFVLCTFDDFLVGVESTGQTQIDCLL